MSAPGRSWKDRIVARRASGRLPHSFLITGPRGAGKGDAALWIARCAVCEGESRPCGECEPCRQFEKRSDLDLRILRPVGMPFWIDAEEMVRRLPQGCEEGLAEMVKAKFLLQPLPRVAGRRKVPLHLNPAPLFRKGKGSARADRGRFEKELEASSLGEGEKAILTAIMAGSFSLDWFASSIGIGHLVGEGEKGRRDSGILSFLRMKPAARRRKVVILEETESMTEQAQNALLKTLEEPPEDSLLILTTTSRDSMFDTIRSRCEEIRIPALTPAEMAGALEEYYHDLPSGVMDELIQLAEGVPGRAAEAEIALHRLEKSEIRGLVDSAISGSFPDYFARLQEWTSAMEEGGGQPLESAHRRLTHCMEFARELADGGHVPFRNADQAFLLAHRTLGALRPSTNLRLLMEEFGLTLREVLYRSAVTVPDGGEAG